MFRRTRGLAILALTALPFLSGVDACAPTVYCPAIYAPVCGVNGKTYSSECHAQAAGVAVAYAGECSDGEFCGGFAGFTCPEGQFCDYPLEHQCGIADGSGVCREIPDACTLQYDPVCGCDGNTYGNACAANASGTSVAHPDACDAI